MEAISRVLALADGRGLMAWRRPCGRRALLHYVRRYPPLPFDRIRPRRIGIGAFILEPVLPILCVVRTLLHLAVSWRGPGGERSRGKLLSRQAARSPSSEVVESA